MRDTWVIVLVVLGINGIYFAVRKDNAKRARFSAKFALWMMLGFAVLGGLFIAGYALEDPGGSEGALLVAAWAVPLVVLSILAWKKPDLTKPLLFIFAGAAVLANVLTLVFPDKYWTFFNTEGPWLGVGSFVFTIVATVYGYHADRKQAGWLNILIALMPFVATLISGDPMAALAGGSSAAALTPGFTAGILLLLSDRFAKQAN